MMSTKTLGLEVHDTIGCCDSQHRSPRSLTDRSDIGDRTKAVSHDDLGEPVSHLHQPLVPAIVEPGMKDHPVSVSAPRALILPPISSCRDPRHPVCNHPKTDGGSCLAECALDPRSGAGLSQSAVPDYEMPPVHRSAILSMAAIRRICAKVLLIDPGDSAPLLSGIWTGAAAAAAKRPATMVARRSELARRTAHGSVMLGAVVVMTDMAFSLGPAALDAPLITSRNATARIGTRLATIPRPLLSKPPHPFAAGEEAGERAAPDQPNSRRTP